MHWNLFLHSQGWLIQNKLQQIQAFTIKIIGEVINAKTMLLLFLLLLFCKNRWYFFVGVTTIIFYVEGDIFLRVVISKE